MCCQGFDEALGTAFKTFIYQIIVFDSTLEKTSTLMSILEKKLRIIERENMFVHDKKGWQSIMLGTHFYSFEIECAISRFLIFTNILQSKCERSATNQQWNGK